jgi:hypothetical protein
VTMRIDDLCSPVLVKEVRQALRGRTFAFGFTVALGLAGVMVCMALVELGRGPGEEVVMPTYFVLAAVLLVFVPFHAQQSMRQEEAEGARDLLALSPMGPWRIVLGKLAAALVLAGLTLAAFLPFVVVIALQPAVDTAGVLALIAHISGVTVFVTALGVASGAMRSNRFLKGGGVVILSFVALGLLAFEVRVAESLLRGDLRPGTLSLVVGSWLGPAAFAPLLLGIAAAGLARDDRDISHGLRIAWFVFAGAMALMLAVAIPMLGESADVIVMCAVFTILAGSFVALVLVTEDERLDRESRHWLGRVPGRPLRAVCGLFAVGGGRGAALTLALGSLVAVSALYGVARVSSGSSRGWPSSPFPGHASIVTHELLTKAGFVLATAIGTSLAFAVFPAHVLGRPTSKPGARRIARWSAALAFMSLSVFLPVLLMVTSRGSFDEDALFFSPLFVLMEAASDVKRARSPAAAVFLWALVGLGALFLAAPSVARGIREVDERVRARDRDRH